VRACVRVVCTRIKNILRFLDPPTSVLIKYLVIRRKVRLFTHRTMSHGCHISLTYPSLFVFLSFLFAVRCYCSLNRIHLNKLCRNCNLLLPRCDTNLVPFRRIFVALLKKNFSYYLNKKRLSLRNFFTHISFRLQKIFNKNQVEKNAL